MAGTRTLRVKNTTTRDGIENATAARTFTCPRRQ